MDLKAGDIVFVDTNILLMATDRRRAGHQEALWVMAHAGERGIHLALSGQIVREYLVVSTRPVDRNGLGLGIKEALANVAEFLRHTTLYDETADVSTRLCALARTCGITGARLHDANVAATMQAHGLNLLLSLNAADFENLPGIQLVNLAALAAALAG